MAAAGEPAQVLAADREFLLGAAEVRVAYQLSAGVFRDLARGQPVPHTLNG